MADGAPLDLTQGIPVRDVPDGGMVHGDAAGDAVILARRGGAFFAVGASCTHYHAPLADGLVVGDTLRCPWHHACFSLRTGEALRAPALDPLACYRVELVGDSVFVREKLPDPGPPATAEGPRAVVIVGGGAAGLAAADRLRREGYGGTLTLISADAEAPYDRPNLSKDFLAGTAPADWIPLRTPEYYAARRIDLVLGSKVASIDAAARRLRLENGASHAFDALLLATGADPIRLPVEGAAPSQVHYVRSFADSKALVARADGAARVVVVGASFIGLEVAASLRKRGLEVHVVAPEAQPLAKILGPELGGRIRKLHEAHGVAFHLGETVARVAGRSVTLSGGSTVDADFLVLGVGVRPSLALAEQAGLAMDRGVAVDEYLETSAPGIFAAGDIARWPDPHSGQRIRVEHWVVAERQGQVAAQNILGRRVRYDAVPFFWSQHYDVAIQYVGHAEQWDRIEIDGTIAQRDAQVRYLKDGRALAVVTIGRDVASLRAEIELERVVAG